MIFTTIYRPTGRTYYCRFVRQSDNYIWDDNAEALAVAPSWVNSAVDMDEISGTGQYPIVVPTNLTKGIIYDAVLYLQAGASPANTDTVDSGYVFKYGGKFGF